jgi:transposase-like protein
MSKSSWPSVGSRSTTSPSTGGCSASRRSSRRRPGRADTRWVDRWYVDETYVKVAGRWRYVYRAIDQYGQIIDVYVSPRLDTRAARRFFATALGAHDEPAEVVTDRAWTLLAVVDELMPAVFHNTRGTRTIGSRPTTGDSKPGSARCVDSNATTRRE